MEFIEHSVRIAREFAEPQMRSMSSSKGRYGLPQEFTRITSACTLRGLFGIENRRPSPADAAKTEEALRKFGKTCEFHTYENAGHTFFAVDRPQYRVHAAVDGWKRVLAWFGRYLR